MTLPAIDVLRGEVRARIREYGLRPLASTLPGVGLGQLRSVRDGRSPTADTIQALCDGLGLKFYIGPEPPPQGDYSQGDFGRIRNTAVFPATPEPPPPPQGDYSQGDFGRIKRPGSGPPLQKLVDEPCLAEALQALADEYRGLNDHGRESLLVKFWHFFPELKEHAPPDPRLRPPMPLDDSLGSAIQERPPRRSPLTKHSHKETP